MPLAHDPRRSIDRAQKTETTNPALLQVEEIRHLGLPFEIDWDSVAEAANYCDQLVSTTQETKA